MKPKTEITIPDEILKEIEAYSKAENITLDEFVIWALGEKVGELRGRRGVNFIRKLIIFLSRKTVLLDLDHPRRGTLAGCTLI
jgi:hypothetical protein